MTVSTDSIFAVFDALTPEQQQSLIEQLQFRTIARKSLRNGAVQEIEVLGGYDLTYDDQSTKIRLPKDVESTVLGFTTRTEVHDYLKGLKDEEVLWRYRFLQYRYLQDGSLWQIFANAHIQRGTPTASPLEEKDLNLLIAPLD